MISADPPWLIKARACVGLREIPGPQHNKTIQFWLAKLGAWWKDDETPWCGTFVAHCLQEAGHPVPQHWYRAKAWADYGSQLQFSRIAPGAILVFDRKGGGHVGFYTGETATAFRVLGGNQSNGVNETWIGKGRCIAARWPKGVPVIGSPVRLAGTGQPLSTNEA